MQMPIKKMQIAIKTAVWHILFKSCIIQYTQLKHPHIQYSTVHTHYAARNGSKRATGKHDAFRAPRSIHGLGILLHSFPCLIKIRTKISQLKGQKQPHQMLSDASSISLAETVFFFFVMLFFFFTLLGSQSTSMSEELVRKHIDACLQSPGTGSAMVSGHFSQ